VTAYVDNVPDAALMAAPPAAGAITAEKSIREAGVTEWTLSNGARVVLYPTTFKQDEVFFRAISPGGASLVADADYVAAATAAQVVAAGGLAGFDAVTLDKVLAGRVATVMPFVEESFEGLAGGGSARDLETLLQLVHLRFTSPRADATAFGVMLEQVKSLAANRRSDPDTLFEDTVTAALWQDHFRKRPLSEELIKEMSLEKSMAFYKDRFADAGDFVFVFAGSVDPAVAKPLVARYLASLPSKGRKESWKDTGIAPVRGVVEKVVEKGLEPQSRVRIVFSGPFRWEAEQRVLLRLLGQILEGQLGAVLREDQSGTYGVKVTTASDKVPKPTYAVSIDFSCAPERTEDLVKRLFLEIARMRMDELSDTYLRGVREAMVREFETNSHENRWAVAQITDAYENGDDVRDALREPALNRTLTPAMIQDAARMYLDTRNYVRVTLVPEKK
jgi:zinc protease